MRSSADTVPSPGVVAWWPSQRSPCAPAAPEMATDDRRGRGTRTAGAMRMERPQCRKRADEWNCGMAPPPASVNGPVRQWSGYSSSALVTGLKARTTDLILVDGERGSRTPSGTEAARAESARATLYVAPSRHESEHCTGLTVSRRSRHVPSIGGRRLAIEPDMQRRPALPGGISVLREWDRAGSRWRGHPEGRNQAAATRRRPSGIDESTTTMRPHRIQRNNE